MTAGFLREPLELGRRAVHQWSEELGLPAGWLTVKFHSHFRDGSFRFMQKCMVVNDYTLQRGTAAIAAWTYER